MPVHSRDRLLDALYLLRQRLGGTGPLACFRASGAVYRTGHRCLRKHPDASLSRIAHIVQRLYVNCAAPT